MYLTIFFSCQVTNSTEDSVNKRELTTSYCKQAAALASGIAGPGGSRIQVTSGPVPCFPPSPMLLSGLSSLSTWQQTRVHNHNPGIHLNKSQERLPGSPKGTCSPRKIFWPMEDTDQRPKRSFRVFLPQPRAFRLASHSIPPSSCFLSRPPSSVAPTLVEHPLHPPPQF